jgi:hypothetical protein
MRNNTRAVFEMTIGLLVMAGSAPAASTFINTCPFVITSPGDYLLSADLTCGGGNAITINSNNVTLKLEGHKITAGAGAVFAISNVSENRPHPVSGVSILGPGLITNGGANAFLEGVFFSGFSSQIQVNGITVRGSGVGIGTFDCFNVTVTANTLGRNGVGISMINIDPGTISGNNVSGNGTGIVIDNADTSLNDRTVVTRNIVNGNTGDGVQINDDGPLLFATVTVQNNAVSGNGGNGISFLTAIEISNNKSLANGMFDLFSQGPNCSGAVLSGNTFFTANQSCIK